VKKNTQPDVASSSTRNRHAHARNGTAASWTRPAPRKPSRGHDPDRLRAGPVRCGAGRPAPGPCRPTRRDILTARAARARSVRRGCHATFRACMNDRMLRGELYIADDKELAAHFARV
jgi:hypothetical protein